MSFRRLIGCLGLLTTIAVGTHLTSQVKRDVKQPPVQPDKVSWDTEAFHFSFLGDLPRRYVGHSFAGVFETVFKSEKSFQKDEFESTDIFQARLKKMKSKMIVGNISFGSRIAFNFLPHKNGFELIYDADKEELTVFVRWNRQSSFGTYPDQFLSLIWSDSSKKLGSYVGRNAFNRATKVTILRNNSFHLVSDLKTLKRFESFSEDAGDGFISEEIPMKSAVAREAKANLRVLVIGRLNDIPVLKSQNRSEPTLQSPKDEINFDYGLNFDIEDVWVYDYPSGRVWVKFAGID